MHGSILPVTIPPTGKPRDKSSPSGPGVGNCLKRSCPGGWGKSKFSCEAPHFSVDTMVPDRVETTACFQGKSLEIMHVYDKLLNEGAFDAYSNGWRSSQT